MVATKSKTYRVDATEHSALELEKYTKLNFQRWVNYCEDRKYDKDLQPVIVSGFDKTSEEMDMAAYLEEGEEGCGFCVGHASGFGKPTWVREGMAPRTQFHTKEMRELRKRTCLLAPVFSLFQQAKVGNGIPKRFDRCIFIRYYTMQSRKPQDKFVSEEEGDLEPVHNPLEDKVCLLFYYIL